MATEGVRSVGAGDAPCPFCRAEGGYLLVAGPRWRLSVRCMCCGARGPEDTTAEGAWEKWNTPMLGGANADR